MRVWYNGSTSAFQADDAGSIPATRSICRQVDEAGPGSSGVEHILGKDEVAGSIPALGSRFDSHCKCSGYRVGYIYKRMEKRYGKGKV